MIAVVALLLLAGSGLAAVYGALPGPARWLPGDTVLAPAAGDQSNPDIARGGDVSLVVWHDRRALDAYTGYEYETSADIYGLRLDAAGSPLDAAPFVITNGKANQEYPKAAWNGSSWGVVYETYAPGGTGYYEKRLAFSRVDAAGQPQSLDPTLIHNAVPSGPGYWDLTPNGSDWVVVYNTPQGDIAAVKVTAAGQPVQPPVILVPATYYLRSNVRAVCAGGTCLATFSGSSGTDAVLFDANLKVLGAGLFAFTDQGVADMASNGSGYYMIWYGQLPDYSQAVFGSRINTSGHCLTARG